MRPDFHCPQVSRTALIVCSAVPRIIRITRFSHLPALLQLLKTGQDTVIRVDEFPARAQESDWLLALVQQARKYGVPLVFLISARGMRQRLRPHRLPMVADWQAACQHLETQKRKSPESKHPLRQAVGGQDTRNLQQFKGLETRRTRMGRWMQMAASSFALLLVLGTVWGFRQYVAPSATIVVHPQPESLAVEIPMSASLFVTTPDPENGLVPADFVSVFHEVQRSGITSGQRLIPKEKAQGFILVRNISGTSVDLPEGTYVQTGTGQATAFVTTDAITLSADPELQTLIPITAVEAGEEGNVPANSINTIAGSLAFRLQITNPNPTTGGTSEWQSVVTQQDRILLQDELLQEVRQNAYPILLSEVAEGHWLPPETVSVEMQWTSADFFTDETTESLTVTMMVQISGLAIRTADLLGHVMAQVEANTPPGAQLIASTIDFRFQPGVVVGPTEVGFTVESNTEYLLAVDAQQIRSLVVGKTVEEAHQLLEALTPDIQVKSPNQNELPYLPQRIHVRTQFLINPS